jgi:site-specific DNA-methyltransferase (adenine-specific)
VNCVAGLGQNIGPFEIDCIYQGDSLDLMKKIPPGVIDLIVTDPPFAIDFHAKKLNYNRTGENVMGGYVEIPAEDYATFMHSWLIEAYRILSGSGSLYVFSGWNRLQDVLSGLEKAGFHTINHIIWKYQFGVFTRKKFVTSHYHILFAVKNRRNYTFNKIEHYPEDVWIINREYWKGKRKTPTKLPHDLVKKILLYSSNQDDLVFDPFLGSGTVAVVSKALGRHFLGFEMVEEYYRFASDRISEMDSGHYPELFPSNLNRHLR